VIIGIGSRVSVRRAHRATRPADRHRRGLDAWGTPLHDAVVQALDATDAAQDDGGRCSPTVTIATARRRQVASSNARRANVLVYPSQSGRDAVAVLGRRVRDRRAGIPGERPAASRPDAARDRFDLHEQYLLGYSPTRPITAAARNEWRAISVRVKRPRVTIRAREGYYVR
jgi:hypothetical protein